LELAPLVKELEKMVRETFPRNIAVETYIPRDLWPVQGNLTQLHQVLLNLCVNARDAMPEGGRLSFAADNVELTAADAQAIPEARPGKYVSLLVSDSGTGMPPEVKARIFEPFFTTKGEGKGTGIGLATVVRILKAHGGFLRLESEVGQGTSFELFLPCTQVEDAAVKADDGGALPRGQGEWILLAEDEQSLRELITAELTEFGYQVITAGDGAEALRLYRERSTEIRLVITDASMPLLSGPQLIKELRQLNPRLPIILASGEDHPGLEQVVCLAKPFELAGLLQAVSHGLK
ncbi:MAG TPA: ATP-binding protein, partial [Verrucomicrobiae bacterium]